MSFKAWEPLFIITNSNCNCRICRSLDYDERSSPLHSKVVRVVNAFVDMSGGLEIPRYVVFSRFIM